MTPTSFPVRASFWGDVEASESSVLEGAIEADVLVVGAGLAGMSTAYFVKKAWPQAHVVVLEAQTAGSSSSGRNMGNVAQHARSYLSTLVRLLGEDDTRFVVDHEARMLDDFEALLASESIQCEFTRTDMLLVAMSADVVSGLERLHVMHRQYDYPSELLDSDGARAHVNLPSFGALSCGRQGYVQPFLLCQGLKRAINVAGVSLYEASPVLSVDWDAETATARTPNGKVRARHCVLATNAYLPGMGAGFGVVGPSCSFLIATEPLAPEALEQIGWGPRHRIMIDAGLIGTYFSMQMRPNGQFIMGGGGRPPVPADRKSIPPIDDPAVYSMIYSEMVRRFPHLEGVAIDCAWGGAVAMTPSGFPAIGRLGGPMYINGGYNARGVLTATLSGKAMVAEIMGRDASDGDYARYADILLRRDFGEIELTKPIGTTASRG